MGNKQSISQAFNMDVLNKSIQTSLTQNSAKASASGVNVAKMVVEVAESRYCPIIANQKINSKVVSSTDTMAETLNDMTSSITTNLQNKADAKLSSLTGAGSTAIGNSTKVKQDVNTTIKNIVEKTMSTENLSETIASSVNIVDNKVKIGFMECREGQKGLDLTQDITSELVATAVTDALTTNLADDKLISDTANVIGAINESKATGPLQDLFSGISKVMGAYTYIVALCACLMCVLCAGIVYVMMSPAGQNTVGVVGETAGYAGRLAANTVATGANPLMAFK